ncbi:MAG: rhodanese-like protein [Flavipsychrobacter sp.]|nr:rhodanese-like protein [Flavipsychrobacter sp.]
MFNISNFFGGPKQDIKQVYESGAEVIDVRGADEFRTGHFEGSVNIPLDTISNKVEHLRQKGKPVILVCRSGTRSGIATNILKNAGVDAYNGGGWTDFKATVK